MDVLKKISNLMEEQNLTVYALAKKSNLSNSTVGNFFKRNTIPSIPTLESICTALGITLSQFFAEDGELVYLNEADKELLKCWSKLNEEQKQGFLSAIKSI